MLNNLIRSKLTNKNYFSITASATQGIYYSLKSLDLPKGSYVAVSALSCPDPIFAIKWAGYKPFFIDIDEDTLNIDLEKLEFSLENNNIQCVVFIHLFGNRLDLDKIEKLKNKYSIFFIEDCAQSIEILSGNKDLFDISVQSFGNGKLIEIGSGGIVFSNNKMIINRINLLNENSIGISDSKRKYLSKLHRFLYYKIHYLSLSSDRFDVINLVFLYLFKNYYVNSVLPIDFSSQLITKLVELEEQLASRYRVSEFYLDNILQSNKIKFLSFSNYKYATRFNLVFNGNVNVELLSKKIRDANIPSNTMYPPLPKRFADFSKYPVAEKMRSRILNLWLNNVEKEQVEETVNIINSFVIKK